VTATYEAIQYGAPDDDGIARITLHRPERLNALTNGMQRELCDVFARVDADLDVSDRRAPEFTSRVPNDLPPTSPWWDADEWSTDGASARG
jgi:hypothetical protein